MDTITLTQAEYHDLIDAKDHAAAMRDVATGVTPVLNNAELDAYLAAPSPLAYWRKRRGFTQQRLAREIGITQPFLAQLERGRRSGDITLFASMAVALGLKIDDIAPIASAAAEEIP